MSAEVAGGTVMDGGRVVLKGYLRKKSPKGITGMRAWQKRYFHLFETSLAYGKTSDLRHAQGALPLLEVTAIELVAGKPTRFRFDVANRRFDLEASSPDEAENWVAAMKQCWQTARASAPTSTASSSPTASPTLSPHTTAGKFWKPNASGVFPSMAMDTLLAPPMMAQTTTQSRAFTPINMASILQHSGAFDTIRRVKKAATRASTQGSCSPDETGKSRRDDGDDDDDVDKDDLDNDEPDPESTVAPTLRRMPSRAASAATDDDGAPPRSLRNLTMVERTKKSSQTAHRRMASAINTIASDDVVFGDAAAGAGYADYERDEKLADSGIGMMYRVRHRATGGTYLLQVVMRRDPCYDAALGVIDDMAALEHPFLVRQVARGDAPDRSWAVYTFAPPGDRLFDRVRAARRLPEDLARSYVAQVALCIAFLHSRGRSLRAMRSETIFADDDGHVLVVDFPRPPTATTPVSVSPPVNEFTTPELLDDGAEAMTADWWRLGVLLYELLVGFPPFRGRTPDELAERVRAGAVRYPPFCSEPARHFIDACLRRAPGERLGTHLPALFAHPFFAPVHWTRLHARLPDNGAPVRRVKVHVRSIDGDDGNGAIVRCRFGARQVATTAASPGGAWNQTFEMPHDAMSAASNATLDVDVSGGSGVSLGSASVRIRLDDDDPQRFDVRVGKATVVIDVKAKRTEKAAVADVELASGRRSSLRRSTTSQQASMSMGSATQRSLKRGSIMKSSSSSISRRGSIFLQNVSGKIRSLVSKNKIRYQQDGFDLDLTYVTDRLIVMGFPSSSLEGVYRNPMDEVQRFIHTYHAGHCRVVNLCSERSYDPACFDGNVACFPFDDHHPPLLRQMADYCLDVQRYLDADPDNVVATHCKAGKGRTGVMLSAYLLYAGLQPTAHAALAFFAERRTADGKGVTIPSQIRYVHMFDKLLQATDRLREPFAYDAAYATLTLIRFCPEPDMSPIGGCDPVCRIYRGGKVVFDSAARGVEVTRPARNIVDLPVDVTVWGDVRIAFFHRKATGRKLMFVGYINVDLVHGSNKVVIEREFLDGAAKSKRFDANFRVEIFLKAATAPDDNDNSGADDGNADGGDNSAVEVSDDDSRSTHSQGHRRQSSSPTKSSSSSSTRSISAVHGNGDRQVSPLSALPSPHHRSVSHGSVSLAVPEQRPAHAPRFALPDVAENDLERAMDAVPLSGDDIETDSPDDDNKDGDADALKHYGAGLGDAVHALRDIDDVDDDDDDDDNDGHEEDEGPLPSLSLFDAPELRHRRSSSRGVDDVPERPAGQAPDCAATFSLRQGQPVTEASLLLQLPVADPDINRPRAESALSVASLDDLTEAGDDDDPPPSADEPHQ